MWLHTEDIMIRNSIWKTLTRLKGTLPAALWSYYSQPVLSLSLPTNRLQFSLGSSGWTPYSQCKCQHAVAANNILKGKEELDWCQTLPHCQLFIPTKPVPFITALQVHHDCSSTLIITFPKNLLWVGASAYIYTLIHENRILILSANYLSWHEIWHYYAL